MNTAQTFEPARSDGNGPSPDSVATPKARPTIHTRVAADSGSTRGYAGLVPGLLALRYGPEFAREMLRIFKPGFMQARSSRAVQPIRDYIEGPAARGAEEEKAAFSKASRVFSTLFVADSPEKIEEQLLAHRASFTQKGRMSQKTKSALGNLEKVALNQGSALCYDLPLGVLSTGMSFLYNHHVASNMHNLFAEAVAYENDKDPLTLTASDLKRSDNRIVRGTSRNFHLKELERYGTDAVFGGRLLGHVPGLGKLRAVPFGALGITGKAALVFTENYRHEQTTLYEDLVALAESKLNPARGIGRPVEVAEMASLYQKYALKYAQDKSLKDATAAQQTDTMNWAKAEPIFDRMATLMNQTYKYKYDMLAEPPKPGDVADFTLPKLIYLLGHDLIDPYKPERTLAMVEVANTYGMKAVKGLHAALDKGISLEDALKPTPVDLGLLNHSRSSPNGPAVAHNIPTDSPTPSLPAKAANDDLESAPAVAAVPSPANENHVPDNRVSAEGNSPVRLGTTERAVG